MGRFREELRIIPLTAWLLAILISVSVASVLYFAIFPQPGGPPPWLRLYLSTVPLILIGGWILLVGYVYGDARRRKMRHVLWTLLAIFIPYGMGAILYFVMRDPVPSPCPKCGVTAPSNFTFCPFCGTALKPTCSNCGKSVERDWMNCAYCGRKLEQSGANAA